MKNSTLPDLTLTLFDGGAAAEGEAQPGATGGQAEETVCEKGSDAGSQSVKEHSGPDKERRARYRALVTGEFKDLFAADAQRIIDHRFKETRTLQETLNAQKPVLDRLMKRYGAADVPALRAAIEAEETRAGAEAEEAGRRAQERQERWDREVEETRGTYPQFDFEEASSDPRFTALLEAGVSVRPAYEALHLDQIKAEAARAAEKRLADHIRARGVRPQENGASAQNAVAVKPDVARLTRQQRSEIAQKAMRGETITFR